MVDFIGKVSLKMATFSGERSPATPDQNEGKDQSQEASTEGAGDLIKIGFYELFCMKLQGFDERKEYTPAQLTERFMLTKPQLNPWLKKAVQDKKLAKHANPVRYKPLPLNRSILGDD